MFFCFAQIWTPNFLGLSATSPPRGRERRVRGPCDLESVELLVALLRGSEAEGARAGAPGRGGGGGGGSRRRFESQFWMWYDGIIDLISREAVDR